MRIKEPRVAAGRDPRTPRVVDIEFQFDAGDEWVPSEQQLGECVKLAVGDIDSVACTIRVVGEDESRTLNAQFRDSHRSTNVLAFDADWELEQGVRYLGDVAICAAVVNREATQQNKRPSAHWSHIVIHGVLHLCGYDHQKTTGSSAGYPLGFQYLKQKSV